MNRQIKFRGKTIGYDPATMPAWMHGCYYQELHQGEIRNLVTDGSLIFEVDPDTVGQYTGIADVDGREIYEGDIVRIYDGERCFNIVVKWSKEAMAFMACYCDGNQSPLSWFSNLLSRTHEIEVIGNIHDNPDLLEGGKQ